MYEKLIARYVIACAFKYCTIVIRFGHIRRRRRAVYADTRISCSTKTTRDRVFVFRFHTTDVDGGGDESWGFRREGLVRVR